MRPRMATMGASWCNTCRLRWLKNVGSTLAPPAFPSAVTRIGRRLEYVRPFGAAPSRRSDPVPIREENHEQEKPATSIVNKNETITGPPVTNDSLPWYLRTASQLDITSKAPEPTLPNLPEHPPPLLHPLMQHVSLDLGLDDLSLLDLRTLDPPPALGANVIMMVGTARSEKHLHVSADRLCRWLRTEYRLNPYADGLLGRNEIKLKRRRNVRRARLLGTSGRAGVASLDDGIRTGWVCVNVGRVEPSESQRRQIGPRERMVGFGCQQESVNLVVQMFTGEKRAEMDLEGLWETKLERYRKEISSREEQSPVQLSGGVPRSILAPTSTLQSSSRDPVPIITGPRVHVRNFHTEVRYSRTKALKSAVGETTAKNNGETYQTRVKRERHRKLKQLEMRRASPMSSNPRRGTSQMELELKRSRRGKARDVPPDSHSKRLPLMVYSIRGCSKDERLRWLGEGSNDYTSTPFLCAFYQAFPPCPTDKDWDCRVTLTVLAIRDGHPGYKKAALGDLLRSMQLSGVQIQEQTLRKMLASVLSRRQYRDKADKSKRKDLGGLAEPDLRLALDILEDMEHRGYPVATQSILVDLHEAISSCASVSIRASDLSPEAVWGSPTALPVDRQLLQRMEERQDRLHFLMDHLPVPIDSEKNLSRLMSVYANRGSWSRFWDIWAMQPQRMRPRTAPMYVEMFRQIAKTKHQAECIRVLRAWLPQMAMENPSVELNPVLARSIQQCLQCAHPSVVEEAQIVPPVVGEWVRWWRICEQAQVQAKDAVEGPTPEPSRVGGFEDEVIGAASSVPRA